MTYPKPLSEKTLERGYLELGLTSEKYQFCKEFFTACSCLYGTIEAADCWNVYQEVVKQEQVPKLRRKDLYGVLELLRRDGSVPFRIYYIDELYDEETRRPGATFVVEKSLALEGVRWRLLIYDLEEAKNPHVYYYVPEHFLQFQKIPVTPEEKKLLDYVGKLRVTKKLVTDRFTKQKKRFEHPGQRLDSFSYRDRYDQYLLESYGEGKNGYKQNAAKADKIRARLTSQTAAQRAVGELKRHCNVGHIHITKSIQYFFDSLAEMGADITRKDMEKLVALIMDMYNHMYLWQNLGWPPEKLRKYEQPLAEPPIIRFGPNIEKAIAEGKMDREELIRGIEKIGGKVEKG